MTGDILFLSLALVALFRGTINIPSKVNWTCLGLIFIICASRFNGPLL